MTINAPVADQDSNTLPPQTRSYVALGSNIGDRRAMLASAVDALGAGEVIAEVSPFYETPAMMPEGAPATWDIPFLNAVVALDTKRTPEGLLQRVKAIEVELGRVPSERWAPRVIDIDILAYGDSVIDTNDLTVPHAEAHQRLFVLEPWADVAPDYRHPVLRLTVADLLDRLRSS